MPEITPAKLLLLLASILMLLKPDALELNVTVPAPANTLNAEPTVRVPLATAYRTATVPFAPCGVP